MTESTSWFGTHTIPEGQMITARIGRLTVVIAHRPGEWRIGWRRDTDAIDRSTRPVSPPEPITDALEPLTVHRYLTQRSADTIELAPRLADRPVVTRPELPLIVPAGDHAVLFVSTPVWVQVTLPDPERPLTEVPSTRPSDTWFGPNTRHGTVAYAIKTSARLHLDYLPPLVHRAITRVTVRNQAESPLGLERLSVPAPALHLFADRGGGLWTSSLVATRSSETEPARVEIDPGHPTDADTPQPIAPPREAEHRNLLSRAFNVLIG